MSNAEKVEQFFPNQKKRMLLKAAGTGPLMGTDKTRRVRLALKMALDDGRVIGMPEYISQGYNALAKEDSLLDDAKILIELDGVKCAFFATDKTKDATLKIEGATLHSFVLSREKPKKDGEAAPIFLYFTLKTNGWIPELWLWLADNLNAEFWMVFQASQMTLSYVGPAKHDEDEEDEEDEEGDEEEGDAGEPEEETGSAKAEISDADLLMTPSNQLSKAQRERKKKLSEGKSGLAIVN